MNVLIVVPWDQEFGGVASVVGTLAAQLRSRGHRVQFLHPGESSVPQPRTARNGFPAWEFNLRPPSSGTRPLRTVAGFLVFFVPTLVRLLRLLRREKIDVVNLHYPIESFVWFALCRKLLKIRLVTSIHGSDLIQAPGERRPLGLGVHLVLRWSDAIVAPSATYADEAMSPSSRLRARVRVIHNTLELSALDAPVPPASRARPFLLAVAAHNPKKGMEVLLDAFGRLAPRYPELDLCLVGDGPLRRELEDQAGAGGVGDRIHFLGSRPNAEVIGLLRACRVFVFPSRSESFGIAALEALGIGAPVVASRVGGIPEFLEDGVHGLLVPPGDSAVLAGAIVRLLDDPALASRLAAAGVARVREEFGAARAGAEYDLLFTRLLGVTAPEPAVPPSRTRSGD